MLHCDNYKDTGMTFVNKFFITTAAFVIPELVGQGWGLSGRVYDLSDEDLLLRYLSVGCKNRLGDSEKKAFSI